MNLYKLLKKVPLYGEVLIKCEGEEADLYEYLFFGNAKNLYPNEGDLKFKVRTVEAEEQGILRITVEYRGDA